MKGYLIQVNIISPVSEEAAESVYVFLLGLHPSSTLLDPIDWVHSDGPVPDNDLVFAWRSVGSGVDLHWSDLLGGQPCRLVGGHFLNAGCWLCFCCDLLLVGSMSRFSVDKMSKLVVFP